jgi:hypothetical protein
MTSKFYTNCLLCVYLVFQFVLITHAGEPSISPVTTLNSNSYGPIERDCNHSRIVCIEGNQTIFAVKGPLTDSQVNHLCPSTPRQTSFRRNRLPSNMLHPMIIVNVGSDVISYIQHQSRIQKTSNETLPKFSYVLCGTSGYKPNSGLHINANKPVPFDTFLDNSFVADHVKNPPTYNKFEAPDRKFAFREVALGDSLAYILTLFPLSEVNYESVGNHISGYHFTAHYRDIMGRFDKEERLYEFTASMQEESGSLSTALNEFVGLYGKPVMNGDSTLDYDLDPNNNVKSGTYIWKIPGGGYLTISIETIKNTSIKVKMVDINQAEKAAEYFNKTKKQM